MEEIFISSQDYIRTMKNVFMSQSTIFMVFSINFILYFLDHTYRSKTSKKTKIYFSLFFIILSIINFIFGNREVFMIFDYLFIIIISFLILISLVLVIVRKEMFYALFIIFSLGFLVIFILLLIDSCLKTFESL